MRRPVVSATLRSQATPRPSSGMSGRRSSTVHAVWQASSTGTCAGTLRANRCVKARVLGQVEPRELLAARDHWPAFRWARQMGQRREAPPWRLSCRSRVRDPSHVRGQRPADPRLGDDGHQSRAGAPLVLFEAGVEISPAVQPV